MANSLGLPDDLPLGTPVALDTEGSGLHTDGDWDTTRKALTPRARVSVVSLAWYETCSNCYGAGDTIGGGIEIRCNVCKGGGAFLKSWAAPFDQGRVAGKPGRYNPVTGGFDDLLNPEPCEDNLGVEDWSALMDWLSGRQLVMANEKYDRQIVAAGLREDLCCRVIGHLPGCAGAGTLFNCIWDTMLVQGILAPLQSSALKATAQRLWGYDEGDEQREIKAVLKKNGVGLTHRYDLLAWRGLMDKYALKDAELTIRLFSHHQELLDSGAIDGDQLTVIEREFRLAKVLLKMERRGIGFDAPGCFEEGTKIRSEMERLAADMPFDPSKLVQAKKYYFGAVEDGGLGLIPQQTTEKTGAPKLDQDVLRELAKQNQPHAPEMLEYSHLASAIAKWYVAWPMRIGHDGRLRTNFRQGRIESDRPGQRDGGAISGRLSVERVQLQAIPHAHQIPKGVKGVREFFQAKPGCVLWELDLSQAEVRIATWASRCHPMAKVLASGEDVHGATATTVFGVRKGDDDWTELRAVAKRLTFGMLYGAGVRTIREQIRFFTGLDYSEAKTRDMISKYKSTFPEFVKASRQAQQKADKGLGGPGFVRLAGGRRRYFGWGERTHKAFNAVIQGGQAEVAKEWMLAIEDQFPGVLLLMIHDSVVLEIPESDQEYVVKKVRKLGVQIFEQYFSTEEIPIQFKIDAKPFGED